MFRTILSQLVVVCLIGSALASVEYVELDDHNNNLLPLDISGALKTVQAALKNGFRFESVKDAVTFVDRCENLKVEMEGKADDLYEGISGKIKTLLQSPELKEACSVDAGQLQSEFSVLDDKEMGVNVSLKRLNTLIDLKAKLEASPTIKLLLDHLFQMIKSSMEDSLLNNAAKDTSVFFGEMTEKKMFQLDLDSPYKSGCSISTLKPICKLVRKSKQNDVTALGSDVAEFRSAFETKDQAVLDKHVELSGVGLADLTMSCKAAKSNWHAFKVLEAHKAANFIDDAQIDARCKVDPELYLYYEMFKLCQLA